MSEPTLSVFFVVKDEAPTILRALESVLPVADQYVIGIDDTTSDGTKEIVKQFAAEHPDKEFDIYEFTWENHFAKARNAAIERCSKDWIFQLDGHEYLYRGSVNTLRHYMKNTPERIWLISVRMYLEPIWNLGARDVIPEVLFIQTHLWRNGVGIRYEHASHNQITKKTCPVERRMNTPDIVIIHDRPPENAEKRRVQREAMNTPHFINRLNIDPNDERGLFYGTMSYVDAAVKRQSDGSVKYYKSKLRKALPLARKYMKHHGRHLPEQAFEMASKLGEVCRELGMLDDAEDAFFQAMKLQPQRAEGYYNLGLLCMDHMEALGQKIQSKGGDDSSANAQMYQLAVQAERWLSLANDCSIPVTSYYVRGPIYHFMPLLKLCELHRAIFLYTGRQEYFLKAKRAYEELRKRLPYNYEVKAAHDDLLERYRTARKARLQKRERPVLSIFNSTGQFTADLSAAMEKHGYRVREFTEPNADGVLSADVLFSSWCDNNAIALSRERVDAPLFVRLCRYEAYTDLPNQVNWGNVSGLIVPNQTLKRYVSDRFSISCPIHVIGFALDTERYAFKERSHGENVAFVGFIHARKNLQELVEIIIKSPEKHFHIAGKVQQQDLWRYFWWRVREAGVEDRVTFHGWQSDIDKWLDDIDANYLLSTSWSESFGYAIAEAMAKGIMPVIREFEGAHELWPAWSFYRDITGALMRLNPRVDYRKSELTRQWIADRYDVVREAEKYSELFEETINAHK